MFRCAFIMAEDFLLQSTEACSDGDEENSVQILISCFKGEIHADELRKPK